MSWKVVLFFFAQAGELLVWVNAKVSGFWACVRGEGGEWGGVGKGCGRAAQGLSPAFMGSSHF